MFSLSLFLSSRSLLFNISIYLSILIFWKGFLESRTLPKQSRKKRSESRLIKLLTIFHSSHSVAPDKNRGGKLRGNIETGVSIIAPKMSDGVSAHVRSDPLVARPLKKKKKSNLTRFWKTRRPSYWKQFTHRYIQKLSRYNATWFLSIKVERNRRGKGWDRIERERKKNETNRKRKKEEERRGKKILASSLAWNYFFINRRSIRGMEGNKG